MSRHRLTQKQVDRRNDLLFKYFARTIRAGTFPSQVQQEIPLDLNCRLNGDLPLPPDSIRLQELSSPPPLSLEELNSHVWDRKTKISPFPKRISPSQPSSLDYLKERSSLYYPLLHSKAPSLAHLLYFRDNLQWSFDKIAFSLLSSPYQVISWYPRARLLNSLYHRLYSLNQ